MRAQAVAATDKAARYMTQLTKHWSHKFETRLDASQARIVLPAGVCEMTAHADRLEVSVEAADETTLTRMEGVVAEHLNRFAFREPLTLEWARV